MKRFSYTGDNAQKAREVTLNLERILAADKAYKNHDDCHHEQDMDKPAQGVRSDDAEEPQNKKYDCDRI